jgi:hypothetical protein
MAALVGLKGEKVRLVPPDKQAHLENSIRWFNDPDVVQYLMLTTSVTRGMEEERFDRVQKRETDFALGRPGRSGPPHWLHGHPPDQLAAASGDDWNGDWR